MAGSPAHNPPQEKKEKPTSFPFTFSFTHSLSGFAARRTPSFIHKFMNSGGQLRNYFYKN